MVKNLTAMQGTGSNPWVRKIPWRREWQPTPVFLPEEFPGQRSLTGCSPWGCMHDRVTNTFTWASLVAQMVKNLPATQKT